MAYLLATDSDVAIHAQYGSIAAEQNLIAGGDAYLGGSLIVDGGNLRVDARDTNLQLQATGEIWWDRDSDGSDDNAWYRWWSGGYAEEVMRLTGQDRKHELWLKGRVKSDKLDLAEVFPTVDGPLSPGSVVALDDRHAEHVRLAERGGPEVVLGVVSSDPGFVLDMPDGFGGLRPDLLEASDDAFRAGDFAQANILRQAWSEVEASRTDRVPVALAGRVPLRVDASGGPIRPGDRLGLGATAGVAARYRGTGPVVALSLGAWQGPEGEGTVTAFVGAAAGARPALGDPHPDRDRGLLPAGQAQVLVRDPGVGPDVAPVVIFGADPGRRHWIAEQGEGWFVLRLSAPLERALPFRYRLMR